MGRVTPKKGVTTSTYQQPAREKTNNYLAQHDAEFMSACAAIGIAPTGSQYSKWMRGVGAARQQAKSGKNIDKFGTEK